MNPFQVVLGFLLVFFLPGFTLTKAIFGARPVTREHPLVSLAFLSLVLSVAVTVLVGMALGFLPHAEGSPGFFQGAATGAPYLEASLLGLSALLFLVGLLRGAYPRLLRRGNAERAAGEG